MILCESTCGIWGVVCYVKLSALPDNLTVMFGAVHDPDVNGYWRHPWCSGLQIGLEGPPPTQGTHL